MLDSGVATLGTESLVSAMASEFPEQEFPVVATEFPEPGFSISREWIERGLEESVLLSASLLLPAEAGVET